MFWIIMKIDNMQQNENMKKNEMIQKHIKNKKLRPFYEEDKYFKEEKKHSTYSIERNDGTKKETELSHLLGYNHNKDDDIIVIINPISKHKENPILCHKYPNRN